MRKNAAGLFLVMILMSGCAGPKPQAQSSQQAIEQAQTMPTVEAKVEYLVAEANAFVKSDKFDEAISTAKYVLNELDSNSQEAMGIVEKAQEELKKMAQAKLDEAKGEVNKSMDDMKNKIGTLGQ